MNIFSSAKPLSPDAQQEAVIKLRALLEPKDGEPSVEALLRKGGEPGLIEDRLDDETLKRWLRAENFQISKAEARLRAHAQWRATYVPTGRIPEVELGIAQYIS